MLFRSIGAATVESLRAVLASFDLTTEQGRRAAVALSGLIEGISVAAQEQSTAATNITQAMNTIQSITAQTSQGASQTAESIGNLAQLAADLRRSVADFKLPA